MCSFKTKCPTWRANELAGAAEPVGDMSVQTYTEVHINDCFNGTKETEDCQLYVGKDSPVPLQIVLDNRLTGDCCPVELFREMNSCSVV